MPPAAIQNKMLLIATLLAACNQRRKDLIDGPIADFMPPLCDWPSSQLRRFLGTHLRYNDRLVLAWFLLGNGMSPTLLADWCMAQLGYLRDFSAAMHMATIVRDHGRGLFDGNHGAEAKLIWNMEHEDLLPCYTPSFAFDLVPKRIMVWDYDDDGNPINPKYEYQKAGVWYWQEAERRLVAYARSQ